jgi:Flp pilus assembly protein TadG
VALVYVVIASTAMLAMVSLAVDFGRVQVAKTQLQRAVDAAALYGATGASDGTYTAKAIDAANDNTVDNTPLVLQNADIQTITFNTANKTYSIGGASPNGVKITAVRNAARGTAIPLLFGKLIGMSSCNIHATAVAYYASGLPAYGFVGIGTGSGAGVLLQNNTIKLDSYDSGAGAYGGSNILAHGYTASNNGITMTNNVTVSDNVYMVAGQTLTTNGNPSYGTRQALTSALTYQNVTSYPAGSSQLGNINGGPLTLGSGSTNTNYYALNFTIPSGQTLTINGPVTVYVNGNITLAGTVNTYQNLPTNFTIRAMSSAGVQIQNTTLYADIYAPQSPINISPPGGGLNFYGRLIGQTLNVGGNANLHYDEALPDLPGTPQVPPGSGGGSSAASLE